jgi:hypothetical protein
MYLKRNNNTFYNKNSLASRKDKNFGSKLHKLAPKDKLFRKQNLT